MCRWDRVLCKGQQLHVYTQENAQTQTHTHPNTHTPTPQCKHTHQDKLRNTPTQTHKRLHDGRKSSPLTLAEPFEFEHRTFTAGHRNPPLPSSTVPHCLLITTGTLCIFKFCQGTEIQITGENGSHPPLTQSTFLHPSPSNQFAVRGEREGEREKWQIVIPKTGARPF